MVTSMDYTSSRCGGQLGRSDPFGKSCAIFWSGHCAGNYLL